MNGGGKLIKMACSCHLIIIKIYAGPYCKISFEILRLRIERDKSSTETQRRRQRQRQKKTMRVKIDFREMIKAVFGERVRVHIPYKVL